MAPREHHDGLRSPPVAVVIRVIYRWTVETAGEAEFVDAWRAATQRIRVDEPGAMGSTLLRVGDTGDRFVGLARWRRREDVEAFWARGRATPLPGATLDSIEVLEEIEHMTLEA